MQQQTLKFRDKFELCQLVEEYNWSSTHGLSICISPSDFSNLMEWIEDNFGNDMFYDGHHFKAEITDTELWITHFDEHLLNVDVSLEEIKEMFEEL